MVRLTDRLGMTIVLDWDGEPHNKQTNKRNLPNIKSKLLEIVFYALFYTTTQWDKVSEPEDHWSCIAHLSAEDMLKSAVNEEKKFKQSDFIHIF